MQPNQPGRRFSQTAPQQPVYRFPQNQVSNGWQPQQSFYESPSQDESVYLPRKDQREVRRVHRRKRRKVFTLWNLFAVIGIITTLIQLARYVIIPLLLFFQTFLGGSQ